MVMPLFISIPARQAANVALAPTERSMPAVIRQSSMPVETSALNDVCLRMDIMFEYLKKFGDAIARTTQRITSAPNVPA